MRTKNHAVSPETESGSHRLSFGASLFTAFLCMLFGANAVAIKISLTGIGVFTNAGLRFGGAGLTILLWVLCTGRPLAVPKGQRHHLVILSIFFFIQFSLFYHGQSKTTASHAILIANLLPFVVMVLAHYYIPGDTINLKKTVGLIFGFSGIILLFFDNTFATGGSIQGDMIICFAVLIWGAHVVYIKKIIKDFHPAQISFYPMLISTPIFLLCGFIWDNGMVKFVDITIIKSLLYQTFITASFGFVAWNTMIQRFGATTLHSFIFLMPISGVFLGVVMLGEPLTTNLIGSIVLVVAGLIFVNRMSSRVVV